MPAGFVWVVRNISIVWGDVTVSGLDAWVQDDSGAKLFRRTISVAIQDYLDSGGADSIEGRWTYVAGESLQVQTTSGTCDFLVSGYSLALP